MIASNIAKHLFNTFSLEHWRGDLFGGLTAAVVSLPMALAFGVASGAGPAAGLYGAILVGLFAALFGGTSTLISEPTGPMTVVMTAVLTTMMAANPDQGMAMAFTVVMIAGIFQIVLGLLKLGKYITLMPYSVISGFMSGIGIILILLQVAPFLGQVSPPGGVTATLYELPTLLKNIKPQETLLAALTLSVLFFLPQKISRLVPPQLVALILGTLVALLFFADGDINKIGEISLGWPTINWPVFTPDQVTTMIVDGMVLGTLGCIDALLTAMIADSLTRQEHKPDREMVGQGIGNLVSGFFGGLPGAGATMGTVVNIQSGARTALSGVIRALILLIVVFGAAGLTAHIPLAVLAGIAVKVGINILDWSFVKRAHTVSKSAAFIMYGVMLLTVFVDLIVAVGLGVFIANILTIERLSALQTKNIKAISGSDDDVPLTAEEKVLLDKANGRLLLVYLSGPMIFGVSKAITREHNAIQQYDCVVLDLSEVPLIDTTISLLIENTIKDTVDSGRAVIIVKPRAQATKTLQRLGVFKLIPGTQLCATRTEALTKALENCKSL
ncbi:MAG: SulP family sulfate permease [Cellvibrionaceae bacterium]